MQVLRTLAVFVLFIVCCFSHGQAGERVALVIGNGAYAQAPSLSNPVRDARAVSEKLTGLGFSVTYVIDRTKAEMERALQDFVRRARGADVAVLYYAGHGMQVRGKNYFVPIDAKLSDVSDVEFELIELTTMIAAIERGAKVTLIFLDACRDNPFIETMEGYTRAVGSQGLADADLPSLGTLISYAAQPGTVARDGTGRHSPYTSALLDHLGTPGQSITQTLTKVRRTVHDATEGTQIPQDYNSLLDEFYIVPATDADARKKQLNDRVAELQAKIEALKKAQNTDRDQVAALDPTASRNLAIRYPFPKPKPFNLRPGRVFKDCDVCPEMVIVPEGEFMIGSPETEEKRLLNEGPQTKVEFSKPFAIGRFEVTVGEFRKFVEATGYEQKGTCWEWVEALKTGRDNPKRRWHSPGYKQSDRHPVACVNWHEAQRYVRWLRDTTGEPYRLPTEAEWEYAARAGTSTMFFMGNRISVRTANYSGWLEDSFSGAANESYWRYGTVKVDSFRPNKFGLYNVHGNVREWVQDCLEASYDFLPVDGQAFEREDCERRVTRGGAFGHMPWRLRSAFRGEPMEPGWRSYEDGFRVTRDLPAE